MEVSDIILTKAIEVLELNAKEAGPTMPPDALDALKLAIEALKLYSFNRIIGQHTDPTSLPGETPHATS